MRYSASFYAVVLLPQLAVAQRTSWIATWTASAEASQHGSKNALLNIDNQTVRERVRVSIGGARICIRLSNEFGSSPVVVGAVTLGVPTGPAIVQPGSIREVRFGGATSITIPPGAPVLSDPLEFPLSYGEEISVSIYFPNRLDTPTWHSLSLKHAVVSAGGDHTRDKTIEAGKPALGSVMITAVLVPRPPSRRLVVTFGDSIVDGDGSTVDADRNWPSDLIRRLQTTRHGSDLAIANEGIAGNRLLADGPIAMLGTSALARFDRDALSAPGVTHIVLLEGINDIGFPGAKLGPLLLADPANEPKPEDLIGAYRQLIARAHARAIKVIGVTLTPFEGVVIPGYYSESKEATRQAVNTWIRTSGAFDGVIDFDAVLRDPDDPRRIVPRFVSEDHLHPNDAGYQALADAIDLRLFQ